MFKLLFDAKQALRWLHKRMDCLFVPSIHSDWDFEDGDVECITLSNGHLANRRCIIGKLFVGVLYNLTHGGESTYLRNNIFDISCLGTQRNVDLVLAIRNVSLLGSSIVSVITRLSQLDAFCRNTVSMPTWSGSQLPAIRNVSI